MRRSERATRKPDFLTFTDHPQNKARRRQNDDTDSEKSSSEASQAEGNVKSRKVRVASSSGKAEVATKSGASKATKSTKSSNIDVTIPDAHSVVVTMKSNRIATINKLVNICLRSAGCGEWIAMDVDLEPLGPEEIDQLLEDRIIEWADSSTRTSYPLIDKPKGKAEVFLDRYRSFWRSVTVELLIMQSDSHVNKNNNKQSGASLRILLEVLVCFSSIAVASIRDAVSTALLSMAASLIDRAKQCQQSLNMLERQLKAVDKQSKSRDEDKVKAIAKQRTELTKELTEHTENIDSLFNTVYMHRSRDANEEVRVHCLQALLSFASFDIQRPLRAEYLKYLGWACNDASARVRVTAVKLIRELLADEIFAQTAELQTFTASFMQRFVQMAALDVSAEVSLEMLRTLRVMQRQGFLDAVSEETLDTVDALVFDAEASLSLRVEALNFLFDHTEGFDQDDSEGQALEEESTAQENKKRRKSNNIGKNSDYGLPKPRKLVALQVETLTEFAEHHLGQADSGNALIKGSVLLAEAVLHSHKIHLLCDWSTICALLMRESESLVSQALRPSQVLSLLAMFVTAAKLVFQQQGHQQSKMSVMSRAGELLQSLLHRRLSDLLVRFQDSNEHLVLFSELLLCVDCVSVQQVHQQLPSLTLLFQRSTTHDTLPRRVAQWLRQLTIKGQPATRDAALRLVQQLSATAVIESQSAVEQLKQELLSSSSSAKNASRKSNSRCSTSCNPVLVNKEAIYAASVTLQHALRRLRVLSELLPVTDVFSQQNQLNALLPQVLALVCPQTTNSRAQSSSDSTPIETEQLCDKLIMTLAAGSTFAPLKESVTVMVKESLSLWLQQVLWLFRSLVDQLTQDNALSTASQADKEEDMLSEQAQQLQSTLLDRRDALITICESLLKAAAVSGTTEDTKGVFVLAKQQVYMAFGVEAFQIVSAVRAFFPIKSQQFQQLSALAFVPSETLLQVLRAVFEQEEMRLLQQLSSSSKDANVSSASQSATTAVSNTARQLAQHLLLPLSRSLLVDIEHLNKRQAAAVLRYLDDDNVSLQDVAKHFAKKLKDSGGFTRLAETQLTCLKRVFQDLCQAPLISRSEAEEQQDDDFDFNAAEQEEDNGYERLQSLSRRFSLLLSPIGKAKGDALTAALALCKAAVDFCCQNEQQVGFCAALTPFLRVLGDRESQALRDYLLMVLQQQTELAQRVEEERALPSLAFTRLFEFTTLLEQRALHAQPTSLLQDTSSTSALRRKPAAGYKNNNVSARSTSVSQQVLDPSGRRDSGSSAAQFGRKVRGSSVLMDIAEEDQENDGDDDDDLFYTANRGRPKKANTNKRQTSSSSLSGVKRKSAELHDNDVNNKTNNSYGRRSGRSLSQRSEEDHAEANDSQLGLSPIVSSRRNSNNNNNDNKQRRSLSLSPALDLDIEDDDGDIIDDYNYGNYNNNYRSSSSRNVVSSKGKRSNTRRSNNDNNNNFNNSSSKGGLESFYEDDEEEELLDAVPSSRRRFS